MWILDDNFVSYALQLADPLGRQQGRARQGKGKNPQGRAGVKICGAGWDGAKTRVNQLTKTFDKSA